jgi:hypothetical protein
VFLSSTRWNGRYVLRICILSFRTHEDRVRDAVRAVREEARNLRRETTEPTLALMSASKRRFENRRT